MEATRASLLSRVRDPQNREAWAEFERTYRDLILRYCARRGLQSTDRDDVLQRVLMGMARSLPGFVYDPARGQFRNYLYRAVRNAISEHAPRPNQARTGLGIDEILSAGADPQDALWEQEWADHHYRLALSRLREGLDSQSAAMFERILAGARVDVVAQEFGVSPAAVYKAKHRTRDRLKELIQEQIREEDRV